MRWIPTRCVLALVGSLALVQGAPSAQSTVTTVMTGLDNPKGLTIGPEGALYVVETGHVGTDCFQEGTITLCLGQSGAVSRLWQGAQTRVLQGLPTLALPALGELTGAHRLSFHGRGGAFLTIGSIRSPAPRPAFGDAGTLLGKLVQFTPGGQVLVAADLKAIEAASNPDGGVLESNPFAVLAEAGELFATDAAGNSLLHVEPNGTVSTIAVFPSRASGRPTDAVPTSVARGPDGALYVGELTGVPFAAGAARVYRVVPGEAPTVHLTGFTTIIDLTFGLDGSMYVLEHSSGPVFFGGVGKITRITPGGVRSTVATNLDRPTAMAVDHDGTVYVTNHGISMGAAEVLKIAP